MGYHSRNNGLFCYSEDKKYNQSTLIRPYVFVFLFCEGTRPIQTVEGAEIVRGVMSKKEARLILDFSGLGIIRMPRGGVTYCFLSER